VGNLVRGRVGEPPDSDQTAPQTGDSAGLAIKQSNSRNADDPERFGRVGFDGESAGEEAKRARSMETSAASAPGLRSERWTKPSAAWASKAKAPARR
jgi:hypothetical protein